MSIYITVLIYVISFLFFLVIVLGSFGIKRMGELDNMKLYWLGYLPIIQFYVIGKLIDTIDTPLARIPKAEFVLPALPIISILLPIFNTNTLVNTVLIFIAAVIWLYAWNTFFLLYVRPIKKANKLTFIGGILIIPLYFFIFKLRKEKQIT